jgi:hypothetical protein
MTKPVTIPNTFAGATTAIPLSQLDGDFNAVASAINDARTYSNYAADSGSVNAFSITLSGITTTYTAGLRVQFKAANANTGACTIDVNNQGAKNIVLADGSTPGANVIVANSIVDVIYDGTSFQLLNDAGGPNERVGDLTVTGNLSVTGTTSLTGNATIANTAITLANVTTANVTTLTGSNATFAGNVVVSGNTTIATSITGVVKATSGLLAAATAGTDYVKPDVASTFTATQAFNGTSANLAVSLISAAEKATLTSTPANGTINYDVTTQSVLYHTANASGDWTLNFRASSGTTLNAAMTVNTAVTVAFLSAQGATAYYANVVQVDGANVTPKYQGGTAFTAGNASSIDAYTFVIVKTGSAAFTVFASQTKFA